MIIKNVAMRQIDWVMIDKKGKEKMNREIRDGKINEILFKPGTLMFLLKESHVKPNVNGDQNGDDDFFWFSEVVKVKKKNAAEYISKDNSRSEKAAQTRYYNFLNGICDILRFDINECSYVNLNPSGGGPKESKGYLGKVREFSTKTKDKINELAPGVIICCGTYDVFLREFVKQDSGKMNGGTIAAIDGNEYIIIKTKHPASWQINNEYERIRNTYNELSRLSE